MRAEQQPPESSGQPLFRGAGRQRAFADDGHPGHQHRISSLDTQEQDFFRRYPFYQHVYQLHHNFYSNYNSLQIKWEKNAGFLSYRANYTFAKNLATAASYNNNIVDPVNLRNDYNPVPYDRTQVFNISYTFDPSQKWSYKGGSRILRQVANQWLITGITSVESGFPLASENGENFSFGYGGIYPVEVAHDNQYNPQLQSQCLNTYNIQSGRCVNNMNPVVWLGTPDVQLMPTVLATRRIRPATRTSTSIRPALGCPTRRRWHVPYAIHPRAALHRSRHHGDKEFPDGREQTSAVADGGIQLPEPSAGSFNQENTNNLQLSFQNAGGGAAAEQRVCLRSRVSA